jgi:hypothetical protein
MSQLKIENERSTKNYKLEDEDEETDSIKPKRSEYFEENKYIFSTDIKLNEDFILKNKKEVYYKTVLENLNLKYKINVNEFEQDKKEEYDKLNFESDLLPRIQNLYKLGFNDFHLSVLVHKM